MESVMNETMVNLYTMLKNEDYEVSSEALSGKNALRVYDKGVYVTRIEYLSDGRIAVESTDGYQCLYANTDKEALNIVFFIYHCTHKE